MKPSLASSVLIALAIMPALAEDYTDATTPEGRAKVEAAIVGRECQPLKEAGNGAGYTRCVAGVRAMLDRNPNLWIGTKTWKPETLKLP